MIGIIVAAPGSALSRYPQGDTGRARIGLPVPVDLAAVLRTA